MIIIARMVVGEGVDKGFSVLRNVDGLIVWMRYSCTVLGDSAQCLIDAGTL